MSHDPRFSESVQVYIDSLDWEDEVELRELPPGEREQHGKARKMLEVIVDDVISSRETLADNKLAFIEHLFESSPEVIEDILDERFTRDFVHSVSGCVERLLQLSRLEGSRIPSKITNGYLREAIRAYVLGLPQASVALSRAAMEQALKENIGYQSTRTFVRMNDLLDEAEGAEVIDPTIRIAARSVADEADDVLHEKPTSLDKAYDVLLNLRGILQHLYRSD
jgi:hypothetical protein